MIKRNLTQASDDQIELKQLINFTLTTCEDFFQTMIELMKESERVNNLGPETVGHLIPLSIGHTDRPTEYESKYINNILTKCEFTGIPPDNT